VVPASSVREPFCIQPEGQCEECLLQADCGGSTPFCVDFECLECLGNDDCPTGNICDDDGECGACEGAECPQDCDAASRCDGLCVDMSADPEHCGACDNSCDNEELCADGQCTCRPGLTECDGDCVDLDSNPDHCGGCGDGCAGGEACYDGECVDAGSCGEQSPPGETCGEACVTNFETNPLHCGACNESCSCGRDEMCNDSDCVEYVVPFGCDSCPCGACGGDARCCEHPTASGAIICIEDAESCPG